MYQASPKVVENVGATWQRRTPDELVHLIQKLRWMGREEEAKIMHAQLAAFFGDSVSGGPTDTN
jgi:hypothetical protein